MYNDLKITYGVWVLGVFIIMFLPFISASVVMGTNAGFLTTAPSSDPIATGGEISGYRYGLKVTSPSGNNVITEIGWWCGTASEESNFEVGIFDHNSGDDVPGNAISIDAVNAKGTTTGWKKATGLNIPISASTIYWITAQLDDVATLTHIDYTGSSERTAYAGDAETTLVDPWTGTNAVARTYAIYAIYEEALTEIFYENCNDMSTQWTQGVQSWSSDSGLCAAGNGVPDSDNTLNDFSLLGAQNVNLTNYFKAKKLDAPNDYISIDASNDSGATWFEIWRYDAVGSNDNTEGNAKTTMEDKIIFTGDMKLQVNCYSGGGEGCNLDNINVTDYTVYLDTDPPLWFDNSTNGTQAGTFIEHSVRWTDAGLSGYIFEFDNGTGTLANNSWVAMTGANNWSNVSKVVNSTEGSTIRWRIYANDTAENGFNATDIFQYDTTTADSCSCPGAGNDWEIDMSDYCNITDACDLGTGTLNFTGSGWTNCNASVDTTNLGDPGANGILYIQNSCLITVN